MVNGTPEKIDKITFFNASGKAYTVLAETAINGSWSCDISDLPSGIYLIRFNIGSRVYTKRISHF
jgi:hypothetical protein